MKKILTICGLLCSLNMFAAEDQPIIDDQKLQKEVERVLLEEIFAAESTNYARGEYPYTTRSAAEPGDLTTYGVSDILKQGYCTMCVDQENIVVHREQIFGKRHSETQHEPLNKWVARSIQAEGFVSSCKRRGPYNRYPLQKMCHDQKSNPQVKCNIYDIKKQKCWTSFRLIISKQDFEQYKTAYFRSVVPKNSICAKDLARREEMLSLKK